MRRYLPSSAVNGPVGLGDYTRAMMINRILTICAAVAAGAAGTSLAHAQQGYPVPPGSVYSAAPGPYVQPAAMSSMNAAAPAQPDFDALDDDDAPNAQSSTALPPPGPVLSPTIRAMAAGGRIRTAAPDAPVYSDPRRPPMP